MQILYAALKYDYGRADQGLSFEHHNLYDSLVRMGHDIHYLDIGSAVSKHGRVRTNRILYETVRSERPDALFAVLFRNELDTDIIRRISEETPTRTIAWFSDDHWRFEQYSRFVAPVFNCAVTTSSAAYLQYRALGMMNVFKSQWACNTFTYRPMDLPQRYPVSFVGVPHGDRWFVIQSLRDAGVDVHTFGKGWPSGRISQDQMIQIFNQSAINLNLSNASVQRSFLGRAVAAVLLHIGSIDLPDLLRAAIVRALRVVATDGTAGRTIPLNQIKGRNFEVPGCGGFLLTAPAENLDDYYAIDENIAVYTGSEDLVRKVRAYLADAELRNQIARAGLARTLREHTYAHRFNAIFSHLGLPSPDTELVLSGRTRPGITSEIT